MGPPLRSRPRSCARNQGADAETGRVGEPLPFVDLEAGKRGQIAGALLGETCEDGHGGGLEPVRECVVELGSGWVREPESALEWCGVKQTRLADTLFDDGAGNDQQAAARRELWDAMTPEGVDAGQLHAQAIDGLPGMPQDVARDRGDSTDIGGADNAMQVVEVLAFAVQAAQGGVVERFDAKEHRAHPSLGEHSDGVRSESFGPDVDRECDSFDEALRGDGVLEARARRWQASGVPPKSVSAEANRVTSVSRCRWAKSTTAAAMGSSCHPPPRSAM